MRVFLVSTFALASLVSAMLPAYADGGDQTPSVGQAIIYAAFSAAERETIHQYFMQHPDQLQALTRMDEYAHEGYTGEEQEQYYQRGDAEYSDEDNCNHEGDEDEDRCDHEGDHDHENEDEDQDHEHHHGHRHHHGHGWKSREGGLPPGIAKNLARGKPLPPGIAKQMRPLPPELVRELPPPPQGYERVVVDGKILLVNATTQIVSDVIANVILGNPQPPRH